MKQENAIEVRNLKKKFKVYYDKGNSLKERILFKNRNRYEERWVLNGISFDVKKGEAIGLIGHNGCGKSTTLKLLNRIIYPNGGSIEMKGRVSSLIELGAGFHPDMSGRENIYINASIFGLTKKEIDERIDDIIAFSELEDYMDNPVRTYSSGMYMRLAFAVAINVDADILLIDEILAVGDANFQAKCFNRLRELKKDGVTIVIVSHSLTQIEQICDRSIWLNKGEINKMGSPREVHPQYLDYMGQQKDKFVKEIEKKDGGIEKKLQEKNKRWGNGKARIIKIISYDSEGIEKAVFCTNEKIVISILYEVKQEIEDAVLGIGFFRNDGIECYGTNTKLEHMTQFHLKDHGKINFILENVELLPGEYFLDIAIQEGEWESVDYYTKAYKISIYSDINDVGICRLSHKWEIKEYAR